MVSPHKRKPPKPARTSRKAGGRLVSVQIRTNIPFDEKEVVTRTEVTRKVKNRVVVQSTKVKVPITPSATQIPSNPPPTDCDDSQTSGPQTDLQASDKQACKGPSRSSASNLEQWLQYRDEFTDEFIMHEALYLGSEPSGCQDCGAAEALFRCLDCFAFGPACQSCTVHQHSHQMFHRLQKWNGSFFTNTSLFDLGASYQLGHDISDPCPLSSGPTDLIVLDISGVHTVRITYCFCETAGTDPRTRRCQLLRARLFPATWSRPGTAFSFRLLDFLHKIQTQSKINLYDFYLSLVSVTDAAGQKPPVYRYNELSLALRIWVHLRQIRRGGGAHIAGGFTALAPGSLAIDCPACPHPGKNLVTPHVDSWLNTLYLSMDANFKLKQKERGFSDPPLSNGLVYMVSNEELQEHLTHCSTNGLITEINTCGSNFNAVSQAYTKYAKGYAVTGVGGVDCARHGFKRPTGVVDLQRGERYSNMDFAFLMSLAPSLRDGICRLLLSYDIACQWWKNLRSRLLTYDLPPAIREWLTNLDYWRVAVPKFHLPGHGTDCQLRFNLAYMKWAGRMDGERIEAGWALSTPMATWTRESGPNARRGILDDHWNAGNWRKVVGLRMSLDRNLRRAHAWRTSQRKVANLISETFTADVVSKWHLMRVDFDLDPSKPNPYEEPEYRCTMAQLKLELLKEEVKRTSGAGAVSPHKVSAGGFFDKAIEIEDRMRFLAAKTKAGVTTVHRHTEVLELRNTIARNLSELRQSQRIYMPGVASILDDVRENDLPEDALKIWLPSEIPADDRDTWCLPGIPHLEFRFRYAQADDSLAEVRRLLKLLQGLRDQKAKHPSHVQKNVTRSKGLVEGLAAKVRRNASRYSHARDAMLALDPDEKFVPGWTKRFQKLNEGDIRGPGRESEDRSEGQFTLTWIWLVPRSNHPHATATTPNDPAATTHSSVPGNKAATAVNGPTADNAELADSMRVHWAKCQARAERYEEEVLLTVEEMGRTLLYFKWKQSQWLSLKSERAKSSSPPSADVQRGLRAYALRQANIYETLIVSFVSRWRKTLLSLELSPAWLSQYPHTVDPLSSRPSRGHSKPTMKPTADPANGEDQTNGKSPQPGPGPPHSSPKQASEAVDAALASDTELDDEEDGEYIVDEVEGFDFEE